jgi:imidazolonepropionase-like amidohydrolase
MKRWTANGVSLRQLLYSATLGNARALKIDAALGTLEPGKTAHLLLLGKNPYESVDAYDTIERVILRGDAISREDLRAPD